MSVKAHTMFVKTKNPQTILVVNKNSHDKRGETMFGKKFAEFCFETVLKICGIECRFAICKNFDLRKEDKQC